MPLPQHRSPPRRRPQHRRPRARRGPRPRDACGADGVEQATRPAPRPGGRTPDPPWCARRLRGPTRRHTPRGRRRRRRRRAPAPGRAPRATRSTARRGWRRGTTGGPGGRGRCGPVGVAGRTVTVHHDQSSGGGGQAGSGSQSSRGQPRGRRHGPPRWRIESNGHGRSPRHASWPTPAGIVAHQSRRGGARRLTHAAWGQPNAPFVVLAPQTVPADRASVARVRVRASLPRGVAGGGRKGDDDGEHDAGRHDDEEHHRAGAGLLGGEVGQPRQVEPGEDVTGEQHRRAPEPERGDESGDGDGHRGRAGADAAARPDGREDRRRPDDPHEERADEHRQVARVRREGELEHPGADGRRRARRAAARSRRPDAAATVASREPVTASTISRGPSVPSVRAASARPASVTGAPATSSGATTKTSTSWRARCHDSDTRA